jgi:release factor glutamine methyltransferase
VAHELPPTVDALLALGRRLGVERLDTRLLIAHSLQQEATWVLAHGDDKIPAQIAAAIEQQLRRRAGGTPLAYLLGGREFHGLWLQVDARVLVPRPDTETLVDWALDLLSGDLASTADAAPRRVLDLGTGSGAIALALTHATRRESTLRGIEVWATDSSADALSVAKLNADRLGLTLELRQGDWWQAISSAPADDRCANDAGDAASPAFDLVVSNPPYIAPGDPHLAALHAEPLTALVSPEDGLSDILRIIAGADGHVRPGGWLLLEHGHTQSDAVTAAFARHGWLRVQSRADLAGNVRCTGGQRPHRSPDRAP